MSELDNKTMRSLNRLTDLAQEQQRKRNRALSFVLEDIYYNLMEAIADEIRIGDEK